MQWSSIYASVGGASLDTLYSTNAYYIKIPLISISVIIVSNIKININGLYKVQSRHNRAYPITTNINN